MNNEDMLQITLRKLAEQIHAKKVERDRISDEITQLQEKANTLDNAQAIIAEETSAGQRYVVQQSNRTDHSLSLQEEVLRCLRLPYASPAGSTPSEVVALLKQGDYPVSDSKNFYAAVYTTLARLAQKGEINSLRHEKGRLFRAKDSTGNLFAGDVDITDLI